MPRPLPQNPLPPRPRAVLRLGVAGRRELSPAGARHLREGLGRVLHGLGQRLVALTPGIAAAAGDGPRVAAFYAPQPPLLRLVTGLCEGADAVAADVLDTVASAPDGPPPDGTAAPCLETELAAVLPFDLPAYRDSRPDWFRPEFDRQARRCAYIVLADGQYAKPDPDTPLAQHRRSRAYRAQSALLLRHADILVAAADPRAPGKAGGTLETVQAALVFGLPVVFIDTASGAVRAIEPGADIHSALDEPAPPGADLDRRLADLATWVLADPDLEARSAAPGRHKKTQGAGLALLEEYFAAAGLPPSSPTGQRRVRLHEWVWSRVDRFFRTGPEVKGDAELDPYRQYRDRARNLNYHYAGLYRGAFVLNYALAVVAVVLATLGLALIGVAGTHSPWINPTLLALGSVKLPILIFIAVNTHLANHRGWNDRAVDYRYLAERLRALCYLPRLGSFQPPAAARPYHSSRAEHQSVADWLFKAILRSASPAWQAREETFPSHDGAENLRVRVQRLAPREALGLVRDPWVRNQIAYHQRTALTQGAMDRCAEWMGAWLNYIVVGLVLFDLAILGAYLTGQGPLHDLAHGLHGLTPWAILFTAVLPAAVAALNGVRFQSESGRLAERSGMLARILGGHLGQADALLARMDQADPQTDPGAWSLDGLRLAERIACDCVREVAEWSVLYAKELPEA